MSKLSEGQGIFLGAMSKFSEGNAVQYYSDSNSCWMDTVVQSVRPSGEVELKCKLGAWLSVEEQKTKLRAPLANEGVAPAFRPSARSGRWSAEQALAIGPASANKLGARKAEELTWAHVLDGITSVHTAIDQLNSGALPCSSDFCIVYSASSQCHYILYRNGAASSGQHNAEELASVQRALAEEKDKSNQLTIELAGLQAIRSSQESDIQKLKKQASQEQHMSARNAELETDLAAARLQLEQAKAALATAQCELKNMEGAESNTIAGLQAKLAEEIEKRTSVETELSSLRDSREGLEKQLRETNIEMDELNAELSKLDIETAAKEELAKKLTLAEEEIRALRDSSNLNDTASLNAELERERKVSRSLADQVALAEAEVESLKAVSSIGVENEKEKRLQAEQAQEKLLEANDVLSASRRALEKELLEEKTQRSAAEAELENFKNTLDKLVDS